jgi:hypothetical protein
MHLGLDLGSSRFRALRRDGDRLLGRQVPTAYTALEGTPAQIRLLNQARIIPIRVDDACLIVGAEAESIAAALGRPLIPLLPEGELPTSDPLARQVTAELLESILGVEAIAGCTVVFPHDVEAVAPLHQFLLRMLRLRGITPRIISAAQATGLAELNREGFVGLVLCCGASGASLALIEHGELQATADVPCGGEWIDQQLAHRLERYTFDGEGRRYLDLNGVARWKQAAERSLIRVDDSAGAVLLEAYSEVLAALFGRFRSALVREGANGRRRHPLPVVCQGGATRIGGFTDLFSRLWLQSELDLNIAAPRLASDDNWVNARGCLIHAELTLAAEPRRVA